MIAADSLTAVDARLHTDSRKLADAINNSKASEDEKQASRQLLADFNDQVAASDHDVDGVADAVLDLTAQGYPGNRDQLRAYRDRLRDARNHVHTAREDARQIEALIK